MLRLAICGMLCTLTVVCFAHDAQLPQAHYHQKKASDPQWLERVVQLHGHLGPWVVAGARLGMAGAHAVDAKGHFDAEVTCEGPFVKPPESCFLDGIQLGTGATLGKRTLQCVIAKQVLVKIRNPRNKKIVEIRPSKKLMNMLSASVPNFAKSADGQKVDEKIVKDKEEEYVERVAREIAVMPEEKLLTISEPGEQPL